MAEQRVIQGHCLDVMRRMEPQSVHCILSSPPYWGLRDYGIEPVEWDHGPAAVYGLEDTLELYIQHTLEIFAGMERVLRDDGVGNGSVSDAILSVWHTSSVKGWQASVLPPAPPPRALSRQQACDLVLCPRKMLA